MEDLRAAHVFAGLVGMSLKLPSGARFRRIHRVGSDAPFERTQFRLSSKSPAHLPYAKYSADLKKAGHFPPQISSCFGTFLVSCPSRSRMAPDSRVQVFTKCKGKPATLLPSTHTIEAFLISKVQAAEILWVSSHLHSPVVGEIEGLFPATCR